MALPSSTSAGMSLLMAVLTFSVMQMFKADLAAGRLQTILGGFVGSWFFIFILTAVGNVETILFGSGFQTKLFPEVILCIAAAAGVSALVHRVCATVCIIFSLGALYYINQLSHKTYGSSPPPRPLPAAKGGKGRK